MPSRIQYCVPALTGRKNELGSEQPTCVRLPQLPLKTATAVSLTEVWLSVRLPEIAGVIVNHTPRVVAVSVLLLQVMSRSSVAAAPLQSLAAAVYGTLAITTAPAQVSFAGACWTTTSV